MSLHPEPIGPVPEETVRVARAAFPTGNPYLRMRDVFAALVDDQELAHLFPKRGQPAACPWRLALSTIFQFAEGLSDRGAADAVRARIDWKYALALPLEDPGFDHTVFSEFRSRLRQGDAAHLLLDVLLERFREHGLLKAHGRQRTDSTHVLAAVRALNRVELVRETVRHVLDVLATVAPEWLRSHAQPEWVKRYQGRSDEGRLPKGKEAQRQLAETIGGDGVTLLTAIGAAEVPAWLRDLPAVERLRQVWVQNYLEDDRGLRWRTVEDGIPNAAQFISSPHDGDAHLAKKGSRCWVGYKVHLTETCEDDAPNLITHVETTPAPMADGEVTPRVHRALQDRDLLPRIHVVDTGFLDAALLVTSKRDYGVDLLGPSRPDVKWQAKAGKGFDAQHFTINWEHQQATCPAGQTSVQWTPVIDNRGTEVIKIRFATKDCQVCPHLRSCVRTTKPSPRRLITIRTQEPYEALRERREREKSVEYTREYARRAGIEGTLSQGVRRCGMRRSRYIGLARTHLRHVLVAAALNIVRVAEWLAGTPRAQTRRSPFAMLMASA